MIQNTSTAWEQRGLSAIPAPLLDPLLDDIYLPYPMERARHHFHQCRRLSDLAALGVEEVIGRIDVGYHRALFELLFTREFARLLAHYGLKSAVRGA